MSDHRSTTSFGKHIEYVVIGELLRQRFDIYQTLVDDQGIDCVLRHKGKNSLVYLDIQIKARSKDSKEEHAGVFSGLQIDEERPSRPNYLFIFYSEPLENSYWVIPSTVLVEVASPHGPKWPGRYNLVMTRSRKGKLYVKSEFNDYCDKKGLDLLRKTLVDLDTKRQGMSVG